jgi:hypothetical protein
MQPIFEKCPFKENGKLSKLFRLVLRCLNLQAESDTPQNKILRCIRPCKTRPCGVSDPAELRPRRTKSCGVSDPAEHWQSCVHFIAYTCSAGCDTPQNNVPRGLIPYLTKSCGVSDPVEQSPAGYQTPRNNIKKRIFLRTRKEFKTILGCEFRDYMGSIRRKNQR